MLAKWLENKHLEILERYRNDQDLPPGMNLDNWLEVFEIELYKQYVTEVVKPVKILETLLSGESVPFGASTFQLNEQDNLISYYEEMPMEKLPSSQFIGLLKLLGNI